MPVSIWWIRRDLSLEDNPALYAAAADGKSVIPTFILDTSLLRFPAPARQGFLMGGLRALDADLRARGIRLIVRSGPPQEALAALLAETGADEIFALEDTSPFARRRDELVARSLPLRLLHGITIQPPGWVTQPTGKPYTVYTPFARAWKNLPPPQPAALSPVPHRFPPLPEIHSDPLPDLPLPAGFPPGEAEAKIRLDEFIHSGIFTYRESRDRLALDGTSFLSPYLRFGMLSPRTAYLAAARALANASESAAHAGVETWINELIWREFLHAVLYHFPQVLRSAFQPALQHIPWRDAPRDLSAWQNGQTGYPVVDAAMRQLRESGWMHNRARMITASFLVKDLLINWQEGEHWFFQRLVDGDPASNNGGWQWAAGTGTDAAPYFRIFNPTLQGLKFDPQGDYVRRWVPELSNVPTTFIHEPWKLSDAEQRASGCRIGEHYPAPMVDHAAARQRTLDAYQASKDAYALQKQTSSTP